MASKISIADIHYTPKTLNNLYDSIISTIRAQQEKFALLVKVSGVLGSFSDTQYARYYNVPLTDDGTAIYLDIPKELIDKAQLKAGDFVQAYGTITTNLFKGQLSFRIDVMDLQLAETTEAAIRRRKEQVTLDYLKSLGLVRHTFPTANEFKVTLIYSRASTAKVDADFVIALGGLKDAIEIERRPVTMSDSNDLINAIENSTGNLVVITRGGGDEHEFSVFDSASVLTALARKEAFRITGLGHSANRTLLDVVADYSATTPTAAGIFIRDKIEDQLAIRRKAQEELRRKDREIDDLQSKAMKHAVQAEQWRSMEHTRLGELHRARKLIKVVACICFVAGVLVTWWIRHG